jgi:hypothetical protein
MGRYVGFQKPSATLLVLTQPPEVSMKARIPEIVARLAHADAK